MVNERFFRASWTFIFVCLIEVLFSFKLSARTKKPYRISGEIIYEQQSDADDEVFIELCFKNKSSKVVAGFTTVVYVSVRADYEEAADAVETWDVVETWETEFVEFGSHVFELKVEERVGGNDKGVFIYPLSVSSAFDYEIDFIYVTEIKYIDDEK